MASTCVKIYLCVLILALAQIGFSYKILSLSLMVTPSHKIPMEPLLEELATRGHEVTVVSPIPSKKSIENLKEILTFDLNTILKIPNVFEMKEQGQNVNPLEMLSSYSEVCMEGLKSPALQALRNETFDLIILPIAFNECGGGFAASVFDAPIILFSPLSAPSFITTFYGNPSPPSFIPFLFTGLPQRMTFLQRLKAFVIEAFIRGMVYYVVYPSMQVKYRQILNDSTLLSVEEMYKKTSLILSNSHFSISNTRPFLPNIIEVGGMHCRMPTKLPGDLENFVNGSDGFILFSMGSALRSSEISLERRNGLLRAFSRVKERIIWKWDGEPLPNLPANIKLSKWLPQQDLLGHPKIKLFVTHGGFGSTTEAVYHGVPLVGIPMFSDQEMNMREMEEAGVGLRLDFLKLGEESFLAAVSQVLNDPRYKDNVQRLSRIFRDQPQKPLDRAVYWTEYVIRHKGAPHLTSAGRDLNFFEYHSLDVILFLIVLVAAILQFIFLLVRFIFRTCSTLFSKRQRKQVSFKKQN